MSSLQSRSLRSGGLGLPTPPVSPFLALAVAVLGVSMMPTWSMAKDKTRPADRIVSLGGDATEILYALGLGERIVAVDTTSVAPPEALKVKVNVGYMRQLSAEGVLSTGGTVIVANAQVGPPEVVHALKAASIRFVSLPGNESPGKIPEKVLLIGKAFEKADAARDLARRIEAGLATVAGRREKIKNPLKAIFVLGVTNGRAMVAGTSTAADTMLTLAGAVNAAAELKGYKPLTNEALLGLAPEVAITMRREGATDNRSLLSSLPGFSQSPAGKLGRLIEMDAHYLLGFGPRTHEAALDLMSELYPELAR